MLALLAASAIADPRSHGDRVYVAAEACTGHRYRPRTIVLACADAGLIATHVHYSSYGGPSATATTELETHSCIPNCAASAFHSFPGRITLADVIRCGGVLYYSRARYTFTGGGPYGEPAEGVADIEPFTRCSKVLS